MERRVSKASLYFYDALKSEAEELKENMMSNLSKVKTNYFAMCVYMLVLVW